ncbi:hypothetical protein L1987_44098 [Smallanthus sonchifolius]|uniref:Uncharacterized protein n=1 Tax=Smallanthus sonchifolius TaxID=185202 RepID=A0ACB9GPG8_9ASTR|nr:hypothetical protein L1987_44098 [Smallanthus sonchifolius]
MVIIQLTMRTANSFGKSRMRIADCFVPRYTFYRLTTGKSDASGQKCELLDAANRMMFFTSFDRRSDERQRKKERGNAKKN